MAGATGATGATGGGRKRRVRAGAAGAVLAVVATAALVGFLAGAVFGGEDGVSVLSGLLVAGSFILAAVVGALIWWRWASRRATKVGLSAGRYVRVARQIQRGEVPDDPAELPAAIEIAGRARRALDVQQRRLVWWLMGGAAFLMLTSAAIHVATREYLRAFQYLALSGIFLINPLTMRRQRRRLDAVEQALSRRTSVTGTGSPGGAEPEGRTYPSGK
ncbi:hypothetical protein RM717_19900 [Streptomyces griseus]|uniref:Integral membrane protein n=2 Tax=Streptomyces TaxID=1883 RepID=A0ABU2W4I8_9ACTN|nr:hypothetical protein [Streptomyces griseus]MDT0492771.1 hypothetical protein [Streptomyces griseus]